MQSNQMGQSSTTRSDNWSENWQQQARRLLKPEEVTALSRRTAITFAPGVPPIFTTLVRYYEERLRPGRWWERFYWSKTKLAADCIVLLLTAIVITVGVLMAKEQHGRPSWPARSSQTMKGW
jgi:type IV secretion system protein VirD4